MNIKLDNLWKMELDASAIKFHDTDKYKYSHIVKILE